MSTNPPLLTVTHADDVTRIVLNRADKGNALSVELVFALTSALTEAVESALRTPPRLLVLSGAGKHFCTGFDLSSLDTETDDSLLARFTRVELLLQSLHNAPFDTLALAHGRTMGAGADLFVACRHRWIVGDASFAFPGAAFGLVLGTSRLAEAAGAARASEWVQSGATIDANAALAAGLAQRQLDPQDLDEGISVLSKRTRRLDLPTYLAVHSAVDSERRPWGSAGDAADLLRLVQSAARPGIRDRIAAYRNASSKR